MLAAASERLRSIAAEWARRRQGEDSHAVVLQRRRIYILPTMNGVVFAAVVFAMLLASLQYAASLGFAMTFLLAGMGLVAMQQCHNNLLAITVRFIGADPVHAGEEARFRLRLENGTPIPRFEILARCGESTAGPVDLKPRAAASLTLHLATRRRGRVNLDRFSITTHHPADLFRAWTWINMDASCLVYPEPAAPGRPLPSGTSELGAQTLHRQDEDDFAGLREATPSDPPKRLAWKAFARSEQLLVKEFSGGAEQPCLFRFDELTDLDTEARLSQLTRWCIDAAEAGRTFGIVLPTQTIALGGGDRHLHDCLRALALYEERT